MTAKAFSSKSCPISAERVRALREAFGEDCRVLYVREGGVERGDTFYKSKQESENDRR